MVVRGYGMKVHWIALSFLFALSAPARADSPQLMKPTEPVRAAIASLKEALRKNQRKEVAEMVRYPLKHSHSIAESRAQFLQNFGNYFDRKTIRRLLGDESKELLHDPKGWGVLKGALWFDEEGKIVAIHLKSDAYRARLAQELKQELAGLHADAGKGGSVTLDCRTPSTRALILSADLFKHRFIVWKKGKKLSQKPDVVINSGVAIDDGRGNMTYKFRNKDVKYEVALNQACSLETADKNLDGECDRTVSARREEGDYATEVLDEICE